MVIDIPTSHEDLLPFDKDALDALLETTNEQLIVQDFEPLRRSIETWHSPEFREIRAATVGELEILANESAEVDESMGEVTVAVQRSAQLRAEIFDQIMEKVEELLP